MKPDKNFFANLSVITAIAGVVGFFASRKYAQIDFMIVTFLCIYFFALTALAYNLIIPAKEHTEKNNNQQFISRFSLITAGKFFISIALLLGYAIFNPDTAVSFILLFAVYYLLFTAFEVASLFFFFKKK